MPALIGIVLGALVLSSCASLLEASLLALRAQEIDRLGRSRPRAGRTLRFLKEEQRGILLAMRILNTLVLCAGAVPAGVLAWRLLGPAWLVPFALLFGLLLVLGSEILAGALGTRYARALGPWLALCLWPLLWVLSLAGRLREGSGEPSAGREGARNEATDRESAAPRRFFRAQDLSGLKVKDIMVGRDAVKFLSSEMSLSQALVEAHRHHHTRFPLLRGQDPEQVIGYVNFKDIVSALQLNPADPTLAGICRPILAVDAGDSLASLLERLTREYQHIVVVKGRQRRIVGLATLEDALEAVLGGMSRKAARLPEYCYPIARNRYVAGGGVSVQTLRRKLSLSLPDLDGSLDSLLRQFCGGTPFAEQRIEVSGTAFTVRKMSGARIREAIIEA